MKDSIELHFDSKSEHRDWYLECYSPPSPGGFFSVLTMTILDDCSAEKIIQEMEARGESWFTEFSIPVLVLASRQNNKPTGISSIKNYSALTVLSHTNDDNIEYYWESVPDAKFPRQGYSNGELLSAYREFGMRTSGDLRRENNAKHKSLKLFLWIIRIGTIVIPAIWLIYQELFSPAWFPIVILIYGLLKYGRELCLSLGLMGRTKREKEKTAKEARERHYIYHCKQNPEGFEKLKSENNKRHLHSRAKDREKKLLAEKVADET